MKAKSYTYCNIKSTSCPFVFRGAIIFRTILYITLKKHKGMKSREESIVLNNPKFKSDFRMGVCLLSIMPGAHTEKKRSGNTQLTQ